jgi:hypothetical protein
VVPVAPVTVDHVDPPSVDSCHWTVGVGVPEAAALKLADCPAFTDWAVGWVVTTGAVATVNVTVLETSAGTVALHLAL